MQQFRQFRRTLIATAAILSLLVASLSISIFAINASANAASSSYVALSGSLPNLPAGAHLDSQHASTDLMTITLVLRPNNTSRLNTLLTNLYNPKSSQYHHWLKTGEFNRFFAPSSAQIAQMHAFLQKAGLKVIAAPSPLLMRATGTAAQIQAAFHTRIADYTASSGRKFFQNTSSVQIPVSLSSMILSVSGLTNTSTLHTEYVTSSGAAQSKGKLAPQYGAGPGGSGLTPSQVSSLYDATPVYQQGSRGKGKGATLAVFELTGYTKADIVAYEHKFFGTSENVPLVNINVDGGPITPNCPTGDECGPFDSGPCANGCNAADYSGDIELEADVETQLAIAPKIDRVLIYNAPNDFFGITSTDEYLRIANDNIADSISSSWGLCEPDETLPTAQAESIAFTQMATQGQSVFSAAGDTGAFDCLRGSGSTALTVDDPSSQPFVTGVGGTSFGTFDPGKQAHPSYPNGSETVWNVLDGCSSTPNGLANCANQGATGGGVSQFWGQPSYQHGPGVISSFSQKGSYCNQTTAHCREVPDVSVNADEYTPYTEFCTGDPTTNSTCALFSSGQPAPGWFGIGGTSLSSPVWSSVIALWDSVHGARFGSANFGLYDLFRANHTYTKFFHDITGKNQTENNNGHYPTTPNYDMTTGIGTPRIAGIVAHNF